jgi:hypothetical protein
MTFDLRSKSYNSEVRRSGAVTAEEMIRCLNIKSILQIRRNQGYNVDTDANRRSKRRRDILATVSFDKNVIISEPPAIDKLVASLLEDEARKIDNRLASPSETARGEELLRQCLSHCKV